MDDEQTGSFLIFYQGKTNSKVLAMRYYWSNCFSFREEKDRSFDAWHISLEPQFLLQTDCKSDDDLKSSCIDSFSKLFNDSLIAKSYEGQIFYLDESIAIPAISKLIYKPICLVHPIKRTWGPWKTEIIN
jgi:hypothetical protein